MLTVRVRYECTGEAATGVGVFILFWDELFLCVPDDRITDGNGDVIFDSDPGRSGAIYVHGMNVFAGRIEDGTAVYI